MYGLDLLNTVQMTRVCLSSSYEDVEKKKNYRVLSPYELGIITLIFMLVILS